MDVEADVQLADRVGHRRRRHAEPARDVRLGDARGQQDADAHLRRRRTALPQPSRRVRPGVLVQREADRHRHRPGVARRVERIGTDRDQPVRVDRQQPPWRVDPRARRRRGAPRGRRRETADHLEDARGQPRVPGRRGAAARVRACFGQVQQVVRALRAVQDTAGRVGGQGRVQRRHAGVAHPPGLPRGGGHGVGQCRIVPQRVGDPGAQQIEPAHVVLVEAARRPRPRQHDPRDRAVAVAHDRVQQPARIELALELAEVRALQVVGALRMERRAHRVATDRLAVQGGDRAARARERRHALARERQVLGVLGEAGAAPPCVVDQADAVPAGRDDFVQAAGNRDERGLPRQAQAAERAEPGDVSGHRRCVVGVRAARASSATAQVAGGL